MKEALRNLQISENRKSVKCLILLISMMSLLLLGVTGCSQSDFPLAEDFLLSMIQEKIENEDMHIEALILEGKDYQTQADGSVIEVYNTYTHSITVAAPEYDSNRHDYVKKLLERYHLVQMFDDMNAISIEPFTAKERNVVVKVIQSGMSLCFYNDGTLKATYKTDSGKQEIGYYSVDPGIVKNLQTIVLDGFTRYWTKGSGLNQRKEDPTLDEIWQIKQVLSTQS